MKKLISLLMSLLMLLGLCSGCKEEVIEDLLGLEGSDGLGSSAVVNDSGVTAFSYSYYDCTADGGYTYSLQDGTVSIRVGLSEEPLTCPAPAELVARLDALYHIYDVAAWDGYHKTATQVLDGDGFSLTMGFADGGGLSCSGSNCSPDGFGAFTREVEALFTPLRAQLEEEARQKVISNGLHGQVNALMVTFKQQGRSGRDEYRISIYPYDGQSKNLSVTANIASYEFTLPGEYQFDLSKEIDMGQLQALIEEYELIQWYDYKKTAKDYANAEWFQVGLGFDDGFYITAMGTEHPEHYDEFRSDLIRLVLQWVQES